MAQDARGAGRTRRLSDSSIEVSREVIITYREGLHARPVMRFVDLASRFAADIGVSNISRRGERVDGKSAMQMMLLEATAGCLLRINAKGADAQEAVDALVRLVERGFGMNETPPPT